MVWQSVKNIFACKTGIKQQRKKAIRKTPTKAATPRSWTSSASSRSINQNIPRNIDNESSSMSGSDMRTPVPAQPSPRHRNVNTTQESTGRLPDTTNSNESDNQNADAILNFLQPSNHDTSRLTTLRHRELLLVFVDHVLQCSASSAALTPTNSEQHKELVELHSLAQKLREIIVLPGTIGSRPSLSNTHLRTLDSVNNLTLLLAFTGAVAAGVLTTTRIYPDLVHSTWSSLFPTALSKEVPTWKKQVYDTANDLLKMYGWDIARFAADVALRSYLRRD